MAETQIEIPGFEILSTLGSGGMGTVYKARQLSLARLVAIKTVSRELTRDPSYAEHLQHEAHVEATLKHPNIVQVYEAGQAKGQYYVVMEYVTGLSLASAVEEQGRLSEREVLNIAYSIGRALKYAWSKAGIVHGDIKPANMLQDEDGTIKLGDFIGMSKDGSSSSAFADEILGTANYMSPEQLLGAGELDFRADIYSLGAVLYHLLSGRMPFAELATETVHTRYLTSLLPDILEVADVSHGMAWLLEGLLVRDVEYRPASWADVLRDIERVREGGFPAPPLPPIGASAMQRTAQREMPGESRTEVPAPAGPSVGDAIPLQRARKSAPKRIRTRGAAPAKAPAAPAKPPAHMRAVLGVGLAALAAVFLALGIGQAPESTPPDVLPEGAPILVAPIRHTDGAVAPPVSESVEVAVIETDPVPAPTVDEPAPVTIPPVPEHRPARSMRDQKAKDLKAYTLLLQKLYAQIEAGEYHPARKTVRDWVKLNAASAYKQKAEIQFQRVDMVMALVDLVESSADQLKGVTLGAADEGGASEVTDIRAGQIWVRRDVGGGEVQNIVEFGRLPLDDMFLLLSLADPHNAERNKALWLASRGELDEAKTKAAELARSGQDVGDLRAWIDEREQFDKNVSAYRALGEILKLLRKKEDQEAKAKFASALVEHRSSQVFLLDTVEVRSIREAVNKIPTPAPDWGWASAPTTGGATDDRTDSTSGQPDDEDPAATDNPAAISVSALSGELYMRGGEPVTLKYRHRGEISFEGGQYISTLHDERGSVRVSFPRMALSTFRNLPATSDGRTKYVYGTVNAEDDRVDLLGTRVRTYLGGKPQYAW